jgi:hypothetical protein
LDEFLSILGRGLRLQGYEASVLRVSGASMDHVSRPVDRHLRYLKAVFARARGGV